MKKLLAFVGIILLVGVIAVVGVAKSGEHGVTTVPLSEGEISFDWLVEPKMNSITHPWNHNLGENLMAVQEKEGGSWDLINAKGDVLLKDFYQVEKIVLSGDNVTRVLVVKDNEGKERFATISGDILPEPPKSQISRTAVPFYWEITTNVYSQDQIAREIKSPVEAYNLIDSDGNKVFKEDYNGYVSPLSKDRFIHKSGDKYGIIDRNLNVIVKHEYPEAGIISVDRVTFRKNTPLPERIRYESEQDYILRWAKSWRFGLFDSDGNPILPMEYGRIYSESAGLICVEKSIENMDQIAFFDRDGNVKIPFAKRGFSGNRFAEGVIYFSSLKIPAMLKIKLFNTNMMYPIVAAMRTTTVIDKQGKTLFTINGSSLGYIQDGFFIVNKGIMGGYGLVSSSGRFYPLSKTLASDGFEPRLIQKGVVKVRNEKNEGVLKFTIKEK